MPRYRLLQHAYELVSARFSTFCHTFSTGASVFVGASAFRVPIIIVTAKLGDASHIL